MQLAYSRLNLRWNPFGEASPSTRARLAVVSLPPWEAGRPLVVIGPPGRGKTTHLLALQAQHPEACYYRLHPERAQLPPGVLDGRPLLLDEAQWLPARGLRALAARTARLALASPRDLSPALRRPATTLVVGGLSLARLREIVQRRIEWARRGPGPVPVVADAQLRALLQRHAEDARAIEDALYDHFQALNGDGDGAL